MHSLRASRPSGAAALAAVAILIVAILNVGVPYYALTPGPAQDVGHLIVIKGAKTQPVNGRLLLTTVSLHPIRVAEAVRGWFDPSIAILSRSAIIPPGESEHEVERRTADQMEESHVLAAAAALKLLGYAVKVEPTGAKVEAVTDGVPASKSLRRGDVVVGADGKPVKRAEDLIAAIHLHRVGDTIALAIVRGTKKVEIKTRTVGRPENPAEPIIGITFETVPHVRLPLAIQIQSLGIGGPSAGLMFALGIYDLLDKADLGKGRIVAGTGEIDLNGEVGPVGGIRQKVEGARRAGATLFIVPMAELTQACSTAGDLRMVGVDRLKTAIDALRGVRNAAVRSCP